MKLRIDSPFVGLSEEQRGELLNLAGKMTLEELRTMLASQGVECSVDSLKRFLKRLEMARALADEGVLQEVTDGVADGSAKGMREAGLAVARGRMLRTVMAGPPDTVRATFRLLSAEAA